MNKKQYDKKMFRLIHTLKLLNESGSVSTSELAKAFNASTRTIQRDIQLLECAGFPLVAETKEYRFVDGFALDKIKVTYREKFLLTSICRLFANVDGPLQEAAKGLIDKILVVPKVEESEEFSRKEKVQFLRKIDDVSKDLEVGLQVEPKSKAFLKEIHDFQIDLKNRLETIRKNQKVDTHIVHKINPDRPKQFCAISVPVKYFNLPYKELFFDKKKTALVFSLSAISPNKLIKSFKISLQVEIYYSFWGPFIKPRKFDCFDVFVDALGFSKNTRQVAYESSYGNEELVITRLSISWEKLIKLADAEATPFITQKMLVWDKKKKVI